jgi:hypothetical protein
VFRYYSNFILPDGNRRDDQTSCDPQSGDNGGQLMTGQTAFPDNTGPKPLLLPEMKLLLGISTATNRPYSDFF